ncbi:MAG: arsenate reductase (azurin) small subunit [Acidimicrobiales bacterium]
MQLRRRDFLLGGATAGALVGAGVLVPIGFVLADGDGGGATAARLASFPRLKVGALADFEVGEPVFFDYPFEVLSNLAVRTGATTLGGIGPDADLVAFSNQCTHMGCPITTYDVENHALGPCPCHFTSFDLSRDGVPAFGQATQNLPRILLEIDEDDVYATGVFRLIYGRQDNLVSEGLFAVGEPVEAGVSS